ncbi:hypothetical protein BH20ACT18_BH20ACT18_06760 [soil metagenome]
MLAQSREAFVALDEEGDVVGWNRAAQETFGWSREEAIGRPVAELLIPERFREAHRAGLARHVATGETRVIGKRLELWALRRDGREIPVELVISKGLPGQGAAFHAFLHDISERRRTEQELRLVASIVGDSEDAILSGTPEGIVETWNAGAERLYGYRADEMIGRSIAVLLPDGDLSAMVDVNELVQAGERVRDLKIRERRKDGSLVDVSVSIFPITDDDGRVVRIASIVRDVSERTRGERELREAHARFESAFEHAPIGMAIMSLEGAWLSVNRALCDLLGRTREELLATDFRSVTHPADLAADLELLQRTLRGEIDRYELEKRYLRPDGRIVWGFLARSLVRDDDGQPVHIVTQVQDITARRSTEDHLRDHAARLEALTIEDPLTGLPNHRAFAAELSRRAGEPGCGLSVVLLEVEGGVGEAAGDRLLREVASGLAGVAREDDLVARLEGRCFGLLVDGGAEAARAVVDRAREEVEERLPGVVLHAGAASSAAGSARRASLMARATAALEATREADSRPAAVEGLSSRTVEAIGRILALAREQLEMDVAYLAELDDEQQVLRLLEGDTASFGVGEGLAMDRGQTYCSRMLAGQVPNAIPDVAANPEVSDLPITVAAGVGAYVGLPIVLPDGELYGTLCCVDHGAKPDLGDSDVGLMRFLAGWSESCSRATARRRTTSARRSRYQASARCSPPWTPATTTPAITPRTWSSSPLPWLAASSLPRGSCARSSTSRSFTTSARSGSPMRCSRSRAA